MPKGHDSELMRRHERKGTLSTKTGLSITVGINPTLSDLKGLGTSKLDWRYLEHKKIDRNELQIHTNSQKGTGTKIAEKLNNFEKFERKKVKFQPCS